MYVEVVSVQVVVEQCLPGEILILYIRNNHIHTQFVYLMQEYSIYMTAASIRMLLADLSNYHWT